MEHNWVARVAGHGGPVLDIKWSPFNDNIIASSSEDCAVKVITSATQSWLELTRAGLVQVWYVPDGQMMLEMAESLVTMAGHQRKVRSGQLGDSAQCKGENLSILNTFIAIIHFFDLNFELTVF